MKAWRVHELGALSNLRLDEVPKPEPGPKDVIVRIRSIGLNSSELQRVRGEFEGLAVDSRYDFRSPLPLVPGIEGSGEVAAVGSQVTTHRIGDRVTISYWWCCGTCIECRSGWENVCSQAAHVGFGRTSNGAYAEYAQVPAEFAIAIPDGLSFQDAAALTVGASTAATMLFEHAKLRMDESVLVTGGASNIGVLGIQLARLAGASRIIATAGSDEKTKRLIEMGSDAAINHTRNRDFASEAIRLNGGEGFDVVYDVPGGSSIGPAVHAIKPRGRLVLAGYMGGKEATIDLIRIINHEARILGSTSWTRRTLAWMLDLAARKRIGSVIDSIFDFDQLPAGLARLEQRQVFGKVIVNV